jgi:hypothetical protein
MKVFFALLLVVLLLSGCSDPPPDEAKPGPGVATPGADGSAKKAGRTEGA